MGAYTVSFFTSPDFIQMPADAFENVLNGSSFFSISGADNPANNGAYLIDPDKDVVFKIDTNDYLVSVISVGAADADDEVIILSTSLNQKLFKPESNDKLLTSSGITRPTYVMNQRRTLKRFLIRWGRFINSFLAYLVDGATVTIHNLTFSNNGEFTSEIDTSQVSTDCLMGDLSGASIQEDSNINTDSFPVAKFKPNIINCTIKICDDDYDMILAAHKNRLQSPDDIKNYGYWNLTSPEGLSKSGWLMNMKRSPINRIAKLRLLERFNAFGGGSGIYKFSGEEEITIPGIPDFERTSTLYLKAIVINKDSATDNYLWQNELSGPSNRGLWIRFSGGDQANPNKLLIDLISDFATNDRITVNSTLNDIILPDVKTTIEIWYDGSSDAIGFTANINGSPIALTTIEDNLTSTTLTGSDGVVVGQPKSFASGADYELDYLSVTIDATLQCQADCTNNGLIMVDLSSQGNNGVISLGATDPVDFFLNE